MNVPKPPSLLALSPISLLLGMNDNLIGVQTQGASRRYRHCHRTTILLFEGQGLRIPCALRGHTTYRISADGILGSHRHDYNSFSASG